MDCVGCRKCRLWGKLQVRGLATALKILFADMYPAGPAAAYELSRDDVIALFNLWERLSSSLAYLERFDKLLKFDIVPHSLHTDGPFFKEP